MDYEDEEPSNRPLETNSTWKLCTIAAVLAATACLVLGLSVGLGLPQGSGNDEIDRYDRVVKFFVENGVSSYEDLTTPETPQYLAARWISDEDDAQVPLPENNYSIHNELDSTVYRYVARYVLAVNYFSLRGKGWWVQLNFLSPSDICNWNGIKLAYHPSATITETGGVICDRRTGLPTKLDLGTYGNILHSTLSVVYSHLTLRCNDIPFTQRIPEIERNNRFGDRSFDISTSYRLEIQPKAFRNSPNDFMSSYEPERIFRDTL